MQKMSAVTVGSSGSNRDAELLVGSCCHKVVVVL